MIIRYGRVRCQNYQSEKVEVEYEFDSKWTIDEALTACKAIVFAALRMPISEPEKAAVVCREALDVDLHDLMTQQSLIVKVDGVTKKYYYCFECHEFTRLEDTCQRCSAKT